VALSGGQRQRLALARAVYGRPDIVVLDDTLAALDPEVAQRVFDAVLGRRRGLLKAATVVLATNQLQWLPRADTVIILGARAGSSVHSSNSGVEGTSSDNGGGSDGDAGAGNGAPLDRAPRGDGSDASGVGGGDGGGAGSSGAGGSRATMARVLDTGPFWALQRRGHDFSALAARLQPSKATVTATTTTATATATAAPAATAKVTAVATEVVGASALTASSRSPIASPGATAATAASPALTAPAVVPDVATGAPSAATAPVAAAAAAKAGGALVAPEEVALGPVPSRV